MQAQESTTADAISEQRSKMGRCAPPRHRPMSPTSAAAWMLVGALSGCTLISKSTGEPNEACLTINSVSASLGNCIQAYDVTYKYANGPRPENINFFIELETPQVRESYVPQASPNHCYAAALSTAFKSQGLDYPQELFAKAIANACFGTEQQPLTYSQILFAATRVNGVNGIWFIDRPDQYFSNAMTALSESGTKQFVAAETRTKTGIPVLPRTRKDVPVMASASRCMSRNVNGPKTWASFNINPEALARTAMGLPPVLGFPSLEEPEEVQWIDKANLYNGVFWTTQGSPPGQRDGQYLPLVDPQDVIEKLRGGATVLAGMSEGGPGHVVVVSKVLYAGVRGREGNWPHPSYHVVSVDVVDPGTPETPLQTYTGDDFFKQSRFLFALVNNRKPR